MSNAVIKVDNSVIKKMKEHYASVIQSNTPQGGLFVAKPSGCSITAYKSGKVLFQGQHAEMEAEKWGKQVAKKSSSAKPRSNGRYAPPKEIASMSIIGSDEVGTGDYFGPMTVVAAYVSNENLEKLKALGVKDSKNLTDPQICEIAKAIIPIIPHSVLVLHNEKYNEMQQKGMSQGKMKALLHNQAINKVSTKIDQSSNVEGVLIDQFVVPETYFKHITGKKQEWKGAYFFSTKAEGVHLSVAAASIIARYAFIREFDKLSEKAGMPLQKGAGSKVDDVAALLIRQKGEECLSQFVKLHFANTEKAKKLV